MFAYELTRPDADPAYTTSASYADSVAAVLVNTKQTPVRVRISWALPDGTYADIAADYPIPADIASPGLIARLRRSYERQLHAQVTRGQLPLPLETAA